MAQLVREYRNLHSWQRGSMAIEDDDEGTVPGPAIETSVVLKFMLATALMVATPTALFFASMYGLLDGAS